MKRCGKCGQEKELEEFSRDRTKREGRQSYCKACKSESDAIRGVIRYPILQAQGSDPWAEHPRYQYSREYSWRTHGMKTADGSPPTYELWKALLAFQNNRCAICGSEFLIGGPRRKWSLDHDHKTGLVRGILCNGKNGDNIALGHFERQGRINRFPGDEHSWAARAQAYLDDPPYQKWLRMKAQTGL